MFTPSEALVHPVITSAVAVHEGVHARMARHPNVELARQVFPDVRTTDAVDLLEEIEGFSQEGRLLEVMFGNDFSEYLRQEAADTDERAIAGQEENQGLMIEAGIDPAKVQESLDRTVTFIDPEAGRFAMELMATALPTYVGFLAIDRMAARNADKGFDEVFSLRLKAAVLSPDYLSRT